MNLDKMAYKYFYFSYHSLFEDLLSDNPRILLDFYIYLIVLSYFQLIFKLSTSNAEKKFWGIVILEKYLVFRKREKEST